jgi:hypothetical protein
MSDFADITYSESESQPKPEVAPSGEYQAKIITAEKYQAKSGNWTLKIIFQIDGGKYRDHNEWFSLWSANEQAREIATDIFTRLGKAVGFTKEPPQIAKDFEGKTLTMRLKKVEETWKDDEGNDQTAEKNKVLLYLPPSDDGMQVPPSAVPQL